MIKAKYITVYPKDFKVDINNIEHILWVKDKKNNKEKLSYISPTDVLQNSCNEYMNKTRQFCVRMNEIFFTSYPDNKCPRRILIKYAVIE